MESNLDFGCGEIRGVGLQREGEASNVDEVCKEFIVGLPLLNIGGTK